MGCLGVHFAIDAADEAKLLSMSSDDERVGFVTEDVEARYFKSPFASETDKAWDAIHRCFDGGQLTYDADAPLKQVILGGAPLIEGDYPYIISFKRAEEVQAIANALDGVTKDAMRASHDAIDPVDYGSDLGDDHWDYTWHWFEQVRDFYKRAAAANRAVIFTADQ